MNRVAALALVSALPLLAAVEGRVLNQTTGRPQSGATVTLYKLGGGGPQALESKKSEAEGRFRFDQEVQPPFMVQAVVDGVIYTKMLPPGSPAGNLEIAAYSATTRNANELVQQHMILLEPSGNNVSISETFFLMNQGKTTYNDPDRGTFRFHLPEESKGTVQITAHAPDGVPVRRSAEPTREKGVYGIDFAVKPGESRIDITYELPMMGSAEVSGRLLHKGSEVRVVTPAGVTAEGPGLELLGQEPRTKAAIYSLEGPAYQFTVKGSGSLRAAAPAGGDDEDSGPGIQQIQPRIYDQLPLILGLSFTMLAFGFVLLYRKGESGRADTPAKETEGKRP